MSSITIVSDPQFVASLTDDSRVVTYDRNVFIIQATGYEVDSPGVMYPQIELFIKRHQFSLINVDEALTQSERLPGTLSLSFENLPKVCL